MRLTKESERVATRDLVDAAFMARAENAIEGKPILPQWIVRYS